jgi:hypothetical protein
MDEPTLTQIGEELDACAKQWESLIEMLMVYGIESIDQKCFLKLKTRIIDSLNKLA